MKAILYYIHDPMCSWCWGFTWTLNKLLHALPKDIEIRRLLGGLAADSDEPMPELMRQQIKSNWLRIEDTISGVKFNFDFWEKTTPRRSTYPACRAVIAARMQGEKYDVLMTNAIQRAYYLEARNPSNNTTLIEIANEIGLSGFDFEKNLMSEETDKIFKLEVNQARELYAESFPNLVLKTEAGLISIHIDYNNYKIMLDEIRAHLKSNQQ